MNTVTRTLRTWCTLMLALAMLPALATAQTSGNGVDPIFIEGSANQTCADLAALYGDGQTWTELKVDPNEDGDFSDGVLSVTISNTVDDKTFDWSSTLGVDAVFVKAGAAGSYLYVYDPDGPESTGDTGLTSPGAGITNQISHIAFCYDIELGVVKDAETTFTRTFEWDIDKTVTPATWDLFRGDSGTSEYTVTVTKTGYTDSDWAVSGTITITNPHPSDAATITDVTDVISGGFVASVDCPGGLPQVLPAGGTLVCTYGPASLTDGAQRTNTATVTSTGVPGSSGTADVIFGEPTTVVNDEINVTDTNGQSWTFSDSDSKMYENEEPFTCDGDEGTHDNTATIDETGQSDDASVTVNCYALDVTKDVDEFFTREWDWDIQKAAFDVAAQCDPEDLECVEAILCEGEECEDPTSTLTLPLGGTYTAIYEVLVQTTDITDSDWSVSGEIWIKNPAPMDAPLVSVTDVVSPDIAATVDCGGATAVPAATDAETPGELHCTYGPVSLPDGTSRTNTATATLQNKAYDKDGFVEDLGTTDFSGSADVVFGDAIITLVDQCVNVSDVSDLLGVQNLTEGGALCAELNALSAQEVLTYTADIVFTAEEDCGTHILMNTATVTAVDDDNDTGETHDAEWTIEVFIDCEDGCTFTQGYWKTHSENGPAPYDDTWALLPEGADTDFFLSGQSWYDVFWTPPMKGNAYYILAHQYMAAVLNQFNGASTPTEVQDAIDQAMPLFEVYTPEEIAGLKGKNGKEMRQMWIDLAGILADYNEGLIGPGHCDENGEEAFQAPIARVDAAGEGLETGEELITEDGTALEPETRTASGDESAKDLDISEATAEIPTAFRVETYPNPFNPTTTLRIAVPEASQVTLIIYDMLGRQVARLVDGGLEVGVHQVTWNAGTLPSGMYLYALRAGSFKQVGSMVLAK